MISQQKHCLNLHLIYYTLFLTVISDIMGMGLVFPVLPALFSQTTSPFAITGNQYYSYYYLAMLIVPFGWMVGGIFIGYLSDLFGRKRILATSLAASALSYGLCYIAIIKHSLLLFLSARLIIGLGGGCFCLIQAIMIDIAPKEQLSKYLGGINIASAIGFISGGLVTSVSSVFNQQHLNLPFIVGFWISLVNLIAILCFIPTKTRENEENQSNRVRLAIPQATWFFLAMFLQLEFSWGLFIQSTPLILAQYFHASAYDIATFFVFYGISACFTLLYMQPTFEAKFNYQQHCIWLSLLSAVMMLSLYFIDDFTIFTGMMMLMTLTEFLLFTGVLYVLSQSTPVAQRGQVMGMVSSLIGLSFLLSDVFMIYLPSNMIKSSLILAAISFPWFWLKKQPYIDQAVVTH